MATARSETGVLVPTLAKIDRATVLAFLTSITPLVLGPVTALLVVKHFSSELQGFYYTFGSLVGLQFIVELGLGQSIIHFASHEWSKLRIENGHIVGDHNSVSKLISLSRISLVWYGFSALLVILLLGPAGYLFFSRIPIHDVDWIWPWLVLCVGTTLNVLLSPFFYLIQGCNQVSEFWFYRLVQQVVVGLSIWAAILLGAELWALAVAIGISLSWSSFFLWKRASAFVTLAFSTPSGPTISWSIDVWPMQWRAAVIWLNNHFIFLLFAPVLFQLSGPIAAGQMGLTAMLCSVLLAVSSNWVITKAPRFGVLVAQQQYESVDRLFVRSFLTSLIVVCGGAAVMWGVTHLLYIFHHSLALRILPPLATGLFLLATVFNSATACLSAYLQAHKKDTLAVLFLNTTILILALVVFLGYYFGAVGMASGYLGVVALIQFPMALLIFFRYRVEWPRGGGSENPHGRRIVS